MSLVVNAMKRVTKKKKVYEYEVWMESTITIKVEARNGWEAKQKAQKQVIDYEPVQAVRLAPIIPKKRS